MRVHIEGYTTLTGTPAAILRVMQDARIFDNLAGDKLIDEIRHTAWRCFGVSLNVTGETYSDRAESLLREMEKSGMMRIEED